MNDLETPKNALQPPIEEIKKVIDTIYRKTCNKIILTGGEFLTIPYWREVLAYIKNKGITIRLELNVTLLEPTDIPYLENHVERIDVAFHSSEKKMYRQIMGIKDDSIFVKIIENLRLLGNSRIQTGIFFSPLRINYRTFYDTIKFLTNSDIKLTHINLNRIIPTQYILKSIEEENPLGYFEHKASIEQLLRIRQDFHIEAIAKAYPVCFLNTFIEDGGLIKQINQPCFLGRQEETLNSDCILKLCPGTGFTIEEKEPSDFNKTEWRYPTCRECPNWGICLGGFHASNGKVCRDDSLIIDDQIELKKGIDTVFFDLLAKLYKPFLSSVYKKARFQYTIFSKVKYKHPVGLIAVNRTTANANFIEIALIPDLKEKYYTFLTMNKLFQTLPIEKYGWTVHKANYPSIRLLERMSGGFYENTIKNAKRIEAEGFFKVHQPAPKKMQDALKQLKPLAEGKFREWLTDFNTRKNEKQELQKYLEEYKP
ncbi:MAG: radical SAM protein [Candidatus Aminicenantes bacterium]|nr:radical SAM protein [Candidatus Aminicenantes bacterium]